MHLKFEGINFLPELVLEETLAGGEAGLIRILLSSDKTRVRVGRGESVLMCDNYHQISCGEPSALELVWPGHIWLGEE